MTMDADSMTTATGLGTFGAPTGAGTLPALRPGVLHPASGTGVADAESLGHLNFLYARDYTVGDDWRILWRNFAGLGGEVMGG